MHPLLELLEGLLPVRLAARLGKLGIGEPSILRVEGFFFSETCCVRGAAGGLAIVALI